MIIKQQFNSLDDSLRIGVSEKKSLDIPLHYHLSHYELTYIEGRKGILIFGDKIREFSSHDLVLIPPRIPHTWLSFRNRALENSTNFRFITLQFSPEFFTEDLLLRKEMYNIRRLLVAAEGSVIIKNLRDEIIKDDLYSLKLESDFKTYIKILEILNGLGLIVEFNQLLDSKYDYRGNLKDNAKFADVFGFILNNYTKRIKISEPATLLNLNDTAFSHYFKKRTGRSFTDYINELRLLEADSLILYSNKKISRICTDCGFNNLSNFNRIYKSWKGITPADRRRKTINNFI
jgi:AraC-like DNA-binding protein